MSILDVIYEDNHLLGVSKPAGLLVQGDATGDRSALDMARAYIKETYRRPGNVFVGLVHRIDRPVSGVVLFARTSKAASRLTSAFSSRRVDKRYLAVVMGAPPHPEDTLTGFIERDATRSRLCLEASATAKAARLTYRTIEQRGGYSLLEVIPHTGRHHQIRLQLSAEGCPVAGDLKYDAPQPLPDRSIALHSAMLSVPHPTRDETVTLSAVPPSEGPWKRFERAIRDYFPRGGSSGPRVPRRD